MDLRGLKLSLRSFVSATQGTGSAGALKEVQRSESMTGKKLEVQHGNCPTREEPSKEILRQRKTFTQPARPASRPAEEASIVEKTSW